MSSTLPTAAWTGRRLHFVGIGGAGMSGLALIAHALGATVTGSDRAESSYLARAREVGIEPVIGHATSNLPHGDDVEVVVSTAIGADNPERLVARSRGLREIHRGELLGELSRLRRTIAIAGTHGKTTTASMATHALMRLGWEPSYVIGGALRTSGVNAGWGSGDWLVVEADESDRSFLQLAPEIALVTNIELDHHTTYASHVQLDQAFAQFLRNGLRVVVADEPGAEAFLDRAGIVDASFFGAAEIVLDPRGSRFEWAGQSVRLSIPGAHNVANAAAALTACVVAGADPEEVAGALVDFEGAGRRFERLGYTASGALVVDDYAHHPTEVRAAILAARTLERPRVIAVFQPHLFSRTQLLAREFGSALALADAVCVLDVYPSRERAEDFLGVDGKLIVEAVADDLRGTPVQWAPDFDSAERLIRAMLREGDLCLILGAGDINKLGQRLIGPTARYAHRSGSPFSGAPEVDRKPGGTRAQSRRIDSSPIPAFAEDVRVVAQLGPHRGRVGRIAWSPDGRLIAAVHGGVEITVWDVATGQRQHDLRGHDLAVHSIAFDMSGRSLASVSQDGSLIVWDVETGTTTHEVHGQPRADVVFSPTRRLIATAEQDNRVRIWAVTEGIELVSELDEHPRMAMAVVFNASGTLLAACSFDGSIRVTDITTGRLVRRLDGHRGAAFSVAFHPDGTLASAGGDQTIKLWNPRGGQLLRTLEGHTQSVDALSFVAGGRLLASGARDGTVRLWDPATGEQLATIADHTTPFSELQSGLAVHPFEMRLAHAAGDHRIDVLDLDVNAIVQRSRPNSVTYTSAKVVLVGESGVGKTGLGWRMTHGAFVEHASTHGQQFWLLEDLGTTRGDGAQCEAVLWDLAGQPDYRLIHALFVDDADLALIVFDPTRDGDPLLGVDYWLRQLGIARPAAGLVGRSTQAILVAARTDRGAYRLTTDEISRYCASRGIRAFVATSALAGDGIRELLEEMRSAIDWDERPTTVTTTTFKQIKDFVLRLKERQPGDRVILTSQELRSRLEQDEVAVGFGDEEMLGAVGHLSNHGYLTCLATSKGALRILLAPELLNNLAASIVLEARRNPKGLGSLEEPKLLSAGYRLLELDDLPADDRDVLLDSAVARFLERSICFRQTDPLTSKVYLVFPELINLRKPAIDDEPATEDGVAYTAAGPVENLYASLVVLLGYTNTFTRTNQWRDQSRYVVGKDLVCGFRLEAEREGELDFVLYFAVNVGAPIRTLFQSLFESFLAAHNVTVHRFEPVICGNGHQLNRSAVREQVGKGRERMFCPDCGEQASLPSPGAPITLTDEIAAHVREERGEVAQRSRFEQTLFRLNAFVNQEELSAPTCFVSYAWGDPEQERWVLGLAETLVKAGIGVILDRWDNAHVGSSVPRFIERIERSDCVLVVGTPEYRKKYDDAEPMRPRIVAAEGDLIGERMLGSEQSKKAVLPVLLAGTKTQSLPALLHSRVYADFRDPDGYYSEMLGLVLSLYEILPRNPVVAELERLLEGDAR